MTRKYKDKIKGEMRHRVCGILYVLVTYKFQKCLKITLPVFSTNYHQHRVTEKQ